MNMGGRSDKEYLPIQLVKHHFLATKCSSETTGQNGLANCWILLRHIDELLISTYPDAVHCNKLDFLKFN